MLAASTLLVALAAPVQLPLAGSSSSAELTLRGQYRVRPGWGNEFLATLHLSLPLSRFGGPSKAPGRAKQTEEADDPAVLPTDSDEREPATGALEGETDPHAAEPAAPATQAQSSDAAAQPAARPVVTPKLARETVLRALEHAGFDRARARVESMVKRARYSALLPDLRLRAARRTDETLRLTPTLDDPYRYTLAGGSDLLFEASLTWRFDQLLFGSPELSAERLLAQRSERMQALARQVLDVLFDWQRARLAQRDEAALPEERQRAALDELEARTRLFVMTGGWFGTTSAFKKR